MIIELTLENCDQLEDLTATFVALGEEKKALAIANDMLQVCCSVVRCVAAC